MASTYPACTAYIPPNLVPTALVDAEAEELLNTGYEVGELEMIITSSLRGWISDSVFECAQSLELQNLSFLYGEPWKHPKGRCAYLLQGEELIKIANDISTLFAKLLSGSEPCSFWPGTDSIVECVQFAQPSPRPKIDDGNDLISLFAYLKILAQYCEYATKHNGALIHVQWDGG